MQYKTGLRTTRVTDLVTALGATSRLLVYNNTGAIPTPTQSPTVNGAVPLAIFTLANPVGTVTTGVLTFSAISSVTAAASGTPNFWRMIDGTTDDGTHTQAQGTAGVGSGELSFGSTVASGGTVSITSIVITEGNP